MTPLRLAALIVMIGLSGLAASAAAAAEGPPTASYDDLLLLGDAVEAAQSYRDNFYLHEQWANALRKKAQTFEHSAVEWTATVMRVTREEVLVEVGDAGHTRVVLRHAQPPFFGNLGSVWYCAGPSTEFYNQFAKPVGLRIGSEVPLELARRLRKKDQLRIRGKLDTVQVQIESVFQPRVLAIIADWVILGVADPDRPAP